MEVDNVRYVDKDKYMWDGAIYETKEDAEKKEAEYEANDFQTLLLEQQGKYVLYTRRVVTEIVLEGEAPI